MTVCILLKSNYQCFSVLYVTYIVICRENYEDKMKTVRIQATEEIRLDFEKKKMGDNAFLNIY
jgi:hypothetical protein